MRSRLLSLAALLIGTGFLLAGGGVQWILLPLRAQIEGFSNDSIGIIGMGWAIGFTAGCLVVPRVVKRVGHVRAFGALAATLSIAILLSGMLVHPIAWFFLRALSGLCFSGAYMIIESWLNERSTNEIRGTVFSLYLVVAQGGIMAGQYAIVFAPPESNMPFMIAAILFSLALLPTALSQVQSPTPLREVKLDFRSLYRNSPAALIGVILAGAIAGAWQNFAPVYGGMAGLSNTAIATMLAAAMAGSIIIQFPMGWVSDRIDRRYVLVAIGVAGAAICGAASTPQLEAISAGWAFFGLMALIGGFIYPVYAVLVAHANDHADPEDYVKVSSALLLVYGLGGIAGPIVTARVIEWTGIGGLFLTIGGINLAIALYTAWRITRRSAPPASETVDFTNLPAGAVQTTQTAELAPLGDE